MPQTAAGIAYGGLAGLFERVGAESVYNDVETSHPRMSLDSDSPRRRFPLAFVSRPIPPSRNTVPSGRRRANRKGLPDTTVDTAFKCCHPR